MQEKQNRKQEEKEQEKAYANQTLELLKTRAELEETFHCRKNVKEITVIKENLQMNDEKRQQQEIDKSRKLQEERARIEMLNERGRSQVHPK